MPPILTKPPSQYLPPADAPDALDSPLLRPQKYMSYDVIIASESDLPKDILTAVYDMLFAIYQDWVHQNPFTHLDGGIEEDGKCQNIW